MLTKIDRGVLFMLISSLFSALNGALAKLLSEDLSALEIVFFRNLIGVAIILYALKHTPPKLAGGKVHLLLLRGLMGFSAMILFFYTITTIELGIAITLNKTSPLFVAILAFFILKQPLNLTSLIALLLGFSGVILIMQPENYSLRFEYILGILGGFFAAAAYTTIGKIKDIYDSRVIVLSFMGVGTIIPLIMFLVAYFFEPPYFLRFIITDFIWPHSYYTWALIVFLAATATFSQWLLTKAYSSTKATIIGIVSYTNIPFAIGFGTLLGDAFPNILTLFGIIAIVSAGILVKKG